MACYYYTLLSPLSSRPHRFLSLSFLPLADGNRLSLAHLPPEYPSWKQLEQLHATKQSTLVLKELFAQDPKRFETYSKAYKTSTDKGEDVEIFLDYSKNLVDEEVWKALLTLAKEAS